MSAERGDTPDTAARIEAVRALVDREVASTRDSWARSARADVRCLDCDLRYEERQEYGCRAGEGHGHYYPEDWLAEAEAKARAEEMRYVTLPLDDLLATLAIAPILASATEGERPDCTWPRCHRAPNPCFAWCKCACHIRRRDPGTRDRADQGTRHRDQPGRCGDPTSGEAHP